MNWMKLTLWSFRDDERIKNEEVGIKECLSTHYPSLQLLRQENMDEVQSNRNEVHDSTSLLKFVLIP